MSADGGGRKEVYPSQGMAAGRKGTVRSGQRTRDRVLRRERETRSAEGVGYRRPTETGRGRSEFLSSLPLDSIQLNFEITP